MSNRQLQIDSEHLQFLGKCAVCSTEYRPQQVRVIDKKGEAALIHADCSQCNTSTLFAVMTGEMGYVVTMGMLTDLTKEDLKRFGSARAITLENVLDWHVQFEQPNVPQSLKSKAAGGRNSAS
ncbi:MAG: hypothetical protein HYT42_01575 [Candidatus Sungbacteria bacterium]|nr:hypothetical protein [Candidatus Sungbacteria bacterium]